MKFGIDLSRSILIGDKESDIMAAKAADVGLTMLLGKNIESAIPSATIQSLFDALGILSMWSIDA